jgi:Putative zinc-finger/Predicted integral membrane protein (DUF2275)
LSKIRGRGRGINILRLKKGVKLISTMNCEEIKNLLSEYLDDQVDDRERRLVEKHLENCRVCQGEFEGLKECLKNIDSLDKVKPPPEFLSQIHSRLEERSVFKSAIKKIFFPIRFKIPLEAAGLAAAAVLIVYILNISPENKSNQSIPAASLRKAGGKTDNELQKTSAAKPILHPDEVMAGRVMGPAAPPPTEELMVFEQSAPLPAPGDKVVGGGMGKVELVLLIESEPNYTRAETRMNGSLLRMKAGSLLSVESPEMEERENVNQSPQLIRLKDLIDREGGEIISTQEETDLTRRITIKLPADRYRMFMDNLAEIGDLQPEGLKQTGEAHNTVRIRLTPNIPEN